MKFVHIFSSSRIKIINPYRYYSHLVPINVKESSEFSSVLNRVNKVAFFYSQSSEIYGGFKGVYDYGPVGFEIRNNLINEWRNIFMFKEDMIEMESSIIGSKMMYESSGHVKNFNDAFVKIEKTGQFRKINDLLKDFVNQEILNKQTKYDKHILVKLKDQIATLSNEEIWELIKQMGVLETSNEENQYSSVNLMLKTDFISNYGYLRPEIAQGIFVNLPSLIRTLNPKLPFGVCQAGAGFRNEVSLDHKIFRTKEFALAEVEYFYDPQIKQNFKFSSVKNEKIRILSAEKQQLRFQNKLNEDEDGSELVTVAEAVNQNLMSEHTGYLMGLGQQFFSRISLSPRIIRWRQQLAGELAHYSDSCWDVESLSSIGWVEIAGLACRGDYDLKQHFGDKEKFPEVFHRSEPESHPHVAELSIGVNRVFQVLLEQSLYNRSTKQTAYIMHFPLCIAPYKVGLTMLREAHRDVLEEAVRILKCMKLRIQISDTYSRKSIGKEYTRFDYTGVPYVCTFDDDSMKEPRSYTIRYIGTTKQTRIKVTDTREVFSRLILLEEDFESVASHFGMVL